MIDAREHLRSTWHPVARLRAVFPIAGAFVAVAVGLSSVSCFTQGETTCGQEDSASAPMRGHVVDKDGAPLGGSLVFIELCRLYSDNPDPSKGHPNYRYGTVAKQDGSFELMVPRGSAGIHTFQPGYQYGFASVDDTTASGIEPFPRVEKLGDKKGPVTTDFTVTPTDASPGQPLRISVNVKAPSPKDPLSEEVLVLEERTAVARALDPPRRGVQGKGYPDGLWSTTLNAPSAPGTYVYRLGVTTEGCATGDTPSQEITVR